MAAAVPVPMVSAGSIRENVASEAGDTSRGMALAACVGIHLSRRMARSADTARKWRLFLQFQTGGKLHTATLTLTVG